MSRFTSLWRLAIPAGLVSILLASITLLAAEGALDPRGRPKQFDQSKVAVYALWFQDGAWQLRTTGRPKRGERFTGTIEIDGGRVEDGMFQGFELNRKLPKSDWIHMHRDNRGFDFHLVTRGKVDGLSFKTTKQAKSITFKLQVSGDDNPRRIIVGAAGRHPEQVPFELAAHPEEPKK
jgi:hypothetical protein